MKVLGIAGYSGSGKTTLIEKLIPELSRRGYRIGVLKHAHHAFDIDHPGKDSYRARAAGAAAVMVVASSRWALMRELGGAAEPALDELLGHFTDCDLVLVEGYKRAPIDKIEVHRRGAGMPLLYPQDPHVIAVASDEPLAISIPRIDINDISDLGDFIQTIAMKPARVDAQLKAVRG
jgi:molybdopterin-guanine dinucleotide biosynthesis protein B